MVAKFTTADEVANGGEILEGVRGIRVVGYLQRKERKKSRRSINPVKRERGVVSAVIRFYRPVNPPGGQPSEFSIKLSNACPPKP
jgi:hypothetical protein